VVGVAVGVGGRPQRKLDPVVIMELLRGGFTGVVKKAADGGFGNSVGP
jgi:hypothetical protein